jgi:acyl-CoA dehydrogenase
MQLSYSSAHEKFREEIRTFLDANLSVELREAAAMCPGIFLDYEINIVWHQILFRQGWVAPSWPKAYGGTGWDLTQRHIWAEECALASAPSTAPMGLGMCGPVLIGHGTPQQQAFYLPRILSGEDYWCQGYSEPASGSDLASLALRAEDCGDHYILNGSKIWTTHAHVANRMFCLVRTNPDVKPQLGISFMLLEMDSPGVSVEPILFASGTHEVNQVFFDDVKVGKENLVGAANNGWTVAKYLLEFERGGGGSARYTATLKRIRGATDPAPTNRQIDLADIQMRALQATELRIHAALTGGKNPGPESSLMKNLGANLAQHLTELALESAGYYATAHQPQARAPGNNIAPIGPVEALTAMPRYFNLRAASIAGGTNEVQKNIIAKLVLGL